MNGIRVGIGRAVVLASLFIINSTHAQSGGYTVVERGADWNVLQKTEVVNGTNRVHRYTELATGMNYTNSSGQLVPSSPQITLLPGGGASATEGRHQVYFPANIYNGVIEVVTPDGKHLQSRPLGVSYDDGSNTVFIAELKSAVGYLTASNQVTYRDAFTGFKADLVCTCRRGGFECDLVFRQQPPTPGDYGLDASFSTLSMVTEFFNTQDPQATPAGYDDYFGLQDVTLQFGKLTMTHGKAFAFKTSSQLPSANSSTPVYKSWVHAEGRTFLIETVPVADIADNLDALPLTAASQKEEGRMQKWASVSRHFPLAHGILADTNQILLAKADFKNEPGVVLDYNEIDSGQNSFTFQNGITYYISGYTSLSGSTVFEEGAVLKYGANGYIDAEYVDAITFPDNQSNPVIFTSFNDDSVGQTIDGSSGVPSVFDLGDGSVGNVFLFIGLPATIQNARFSYSYYGIETIADLNVFNCQFLNMNMAIIGYNLNLRNVLFAFGLESGDAIIQLYGNLTGESITADQLPVGFIADENWPNDSICLTNCLITFEDSFWWNYSSPVTNRVVHLPSPSEAIYQSAANANFYLVTNSPYRNAGTTNINPDLLAELQTMTTYAPQDGSWPDTNGTDLGYHYPVNEDSDHDGLPDWWEWHWFGNYTNTGSQLDANGNTLLSDYQNYASGTITNDPNVIAFSIEATNDYVNYTNVSVQLNITAGAPSYYALFVDSASTTNWLPFAGTNLAAFLGTTDGVYNVTIGLKGIAPEATATWEDYSFTLDRVAPKLNLTSAVNATVIKPYLQVLGFADKPLAGLSYDITNAFGLLTNQDAFVTDQKFDTNKFDFTTNYFQAYDVPLATNANYITLRATDRAGNTVTTNFTVTLDYSTATNPPTANLTWPQDGWAVSGTNITIRGTMSDETGSVVAQIINGDGTTNTITGIVERNGNFWLENVPLNGTNQISLQAIDAAGNVIQTNFIVQPSAIVLTIDSTPTGDALWQPTGSVSGRVSDPDAVVTVNGVTADVATDADADGNYSWTADGVPNYGEGTATYDATADTSGGSGGGSPQAQTKTGLTVERPHYVAVVMHKFSEIITSTNTSNGTWGLQTLGKDYTANAQTNGNGWLLNYGGKYADGYDGGASNGFSWTSSQTYQWQGQTPGTESRSRVVQGADSNGNSYGQTNQDFADENGFIRSPVAEDLWEPGSGDGAWPHFIKHYYASGVDYQWTASDGLKTRLQIPVARTQVKLWTGGKSIVGKQSLFCLQPSAVSYRQALDPGWVGCPQDAIAPEKLKLLGKHPGADGNLWIALPDNSVQDITVTAPAKHYNAGESVQKYPTWITANESNLETNTPEFCVGQNVTFTLQGLPGNVTNVVGQWNLPAKFVNQQTNYSPTCLTYVQNNDLLQNVNQTSCWFVNVPGGQGHVSVGLNLKFDNGQTAGVAANGDFTVVRPSIVSMTNSCSDVNMFTNSNGSLDQIALQYTNKENGIELYVYVKRPDHFSGVTSMTQLINRRFNWNTYPVPGFYWSDSTSGNFWLDTQETYSSISLPLTENGHPANPVRPVYLADGPSLGEPALGFYSEADAHDDFHDYVRFQPDGGIPVTVGRVDWGWQGEAMIVGDIWELVDLLPPSHYGPTLDSSDDSFPTWPYTYTGTPGN